MTLSNFDSSIVNDSLSSNHRDHEWKIVCNFRDTWLEFNSFEHSGCRRLGWNYLLLRPTSQSKNLPQLCYCLQ